MLRRLSRWRPRLRWLLVAVLFWAASVPLCSQYFGQNKVRYRTFDFKVLKTEHFDIHYPDEMREVAIQVGRMAERWYARLEKVFDHKLAGRQPLVIYPSHADFRGTTVIPDYIGETTGGVTEGLKRRIVMPLSSSLADTDHVLGHELVHAFQFDISTRGGPLGGSGLPGALRLPLWFIEGMAEYLSVGPVDPLTAIWMRDAILRKDLPPVRKLDDPRYFPYRWGQAFWAYVAGRYGDEIVGKILKAAGRAGTAESAISSVLGVSLDQLSEDWHAHLTQAFQPVLQDKPAISSWAKRLAPQRPARGSLSVGPALSPDGRYLVFFSERDLFSIEMFLADASTGRILSRLTRTYLEPEFDSLQFATSTGAWSHDGKQFAFGSIIQGRPFILIFELSSRRITRRIRLEGLDDVFGLSWSPDSSQIVFSAMSRGWTDLYVIRLSDSSIRRLTQDPYAELTPAWSPDGRKIAFATDRFSANLEQLAPGEKQLALIDPDGSGLEPIQIFSSGKLFNPQWGRDNSTLFFLAEPDGIPNVYRLDLRTRAVAQVTDLPTGVTGISRYSPAFSVSEASGRLAFTAFEEAGYVIYLGEGPQLLAGKPLARRSEFFAANLPPSQRASPLVPKLLRDFASGLAEPAGFTFDRYRPRLQLDYVAPPTVSVGTGNFGPFLAGGTALYFSDLLGYHNLMTVLQSSTTSEGGKFYNSLSGIVAYTNQKSRWDWGFVGGQVPSLTGGYETTSAVVRGQPVIIDTSITYWQMNREISAVLARPFNRAQRIEFSAGYQNISFDAQATVDVYSAWTGAPLYSEVVNIDTPPALHMFVGRTALVYDTSVFGGTSPVAGQSYRLELGATAGSLRYLTLLADYRRYLRLARPLTLAGRLLHYGRYTGDAEDTRQQDIYLGYPTLVRGYSAESFSIQECGPQLAATGACPVFDRLFGSRLAVANAELRLPLLGYLGLVPSRGLPPVESALFYDAGMAWRSAELARQLGVARKPVSSYGACLRINVLGFFVAQLSYVRPLDRPLKKWMWEWAIAPGF